MGWRDPRAQLATRSHHGSRARLEQKCGRSRGGGGPSWAAVGSVVGCWFHNVQPGWSQVGSRNPDSPEGVTPHLLLVSLMPLPLCLLGLITLY